MNKLAALVLLAACGDGSTPIEQPDAAIAIDAAPPTESGAECTAHVTAPTPGVGGLCYTTVTIEVKCNAGVTQTHFGAIVGWARLFEAPTGVGFADSTFHCNAGTVAQFSVPCTDWVGGGAVLQDPIIGGDLWAQIGGSDPPPAPFVTCDARSDQP